MENICSPAVPTRPLAVIDAATGEETRKLGGPSGVIDDVSALGDNTHVLVEYVDADDVNKPPVHAIWNLDTPESPGHAGSRDGYRPPGSKRQDVVREHQGNRAADFRVQLDPHREKSSLRTRCANWRQFVRLALSERPHPCKGSKVGHPENEGQPNSSLNRH